MADWKGKRVLREKDGKTLWAEFDDGPDGHYTDQEEYTSLEEDLETSKWKGILNGIQIYLPTVHKQSVNVKAVRWTNAMRSEASFTDKINLPKPSLFVTDIFEICTDASAEKNTEVHKLKSNLSYKSEQDMSTTIRAVEGAGNKLSIRVKKPYLYSLNTRHHFSAKLRVGSIWMSEPATYRDEEFWFHAEELSAFFIFASSKIETFTIEPTGTIYSTQVDDRIELDFDRQTVTSKTPARVKIWPTDEEKLEEVLERSDEQRITAISDTIFLEHTAPKLHYEVKFTVPLHGDSELKAGDNLYLLKYKPDYSGIEYERLKTNQFSLSNGNVNVTKSVTSGYGNGLVKTRAKMVRNHEVLEISAQGYLCKFLYFKLPGGDESNFQLWLECARKGEAERIRMLNEQRGMIEFPYSYSNDIPIYDQENIQITIRGCAKIRGDKKVGPQRPVNMKFLAVSETTHSRIPLVKNQAIDGLNFIEVEISFTQARSRKPIKSQIDPWGKITQAIRRRNPPKRQRELGRSLSENECFKEKSLQALALAVPPNQAKILARQLSLDNTVVARLFDENNKNIAEFTINMLIHWRNSTDPDRRFDELLEALEELRLGTIVSVLRSNYSENTSMRPSDFE